MKTPQKEQRYLRISLAMIMLLMVWGLIFCEFTDSNIVELDAGAYIVSGLIGIITIYVSKLQSRPSDRVHPFGYVGFVPILNLIRSFMILLICLKAVSSSIGDLVSGPSQTEHDTVLLYAGVTLLFNGIAYVYIQRAYKKTGSEILKVDALEWKIDIYFNLCVMVAFTLSLGLKHAGFVKLAAHIDPVSCIVLSLIMSFLPLKMFRENIQKLSVASVDKVTYKVIRERFYNEIPHIRAFDPHLTTIDMSGVLWVEVQLYNHNEGLDHEGLLALEEKGKLILAEITENYHLTFNFTSA
ncbi:cation transporter [Chitinophaga oryzae]|uniref:Cation transporter n=1 Tax=Chitinophaga oryzae TaxID=2725414 RepID=A0AAE6ZFM9_9BACT|nr:cation transporter [Chitinophaga oryzae]QJB30662.1 cation transporter [Chitinophaga oryzae]QJB37163.1 cation transporter [Chitinophaga oryzae]